MPFYVYLVECSDGTYYCGYTNNLQTRVEKHNSSKMGAKYTKGRRPVKLIYSEKLNSKTEAMKREVEIKKLSRGKKEKLSRLN